MNRSFWQDRKVFLTGHTGFKGSWLSLWLSELGAQVNGFSLAPNTSPSLFDLCGSSHLAGDDRGDIRDRRTLQISINKAQPEIMFHLAAQPLVRRSYNDPIETFETNIIGTANLLEAARNTPSIKSIVVITTDKCYENKESVYGYQETDPLGGYDPYSSSKAGTELVAASYRSSFFPPDLHSKHGVALATARAGNVIGGGDWSAERLIPDLVRSLIKSEPLVLRNPQSSRPWQHVLEPLHGYLLLAERLFNDGPKFNGAWNFGPALGDHICVADVVSLLQKELKTSVPVTISIDPQPHETNMLRLDSSKAQRQLGWKPCLSVNDSLRMTAEWINNYIHKGNAREFTRQQISSYSALLKD